MTHTIYVTLMLVALFSQSNSQAGRNKTKGCNFACTAIYQPVCGSDGVTYGNNCSLAGVNCRRPPNQKIQVVKTGPCNNVTTSTTKSTETPDAPVDRCPLACTFDFTPVCGSDGETYPNACVLRTNNCQRSPYQQVRIVSNGTCETSNTATTTSSYSQTATTPAPVECSLVCTLLYAPVCGSDGVTYPNACSLRVRNCLGSNYDQVTIVRNETCETTTSTNTAVDNGTTTTSTTNSTEIPDAPVDRCPLACTFDFTPVCGSDGETYPNACVLRTNNCQRSPYQQVMIISNGTCETSNTATTTTSSYSQTVTTPAPVECSLACTLIYAPVCGSDGVTYSNACSLRVRNCLGSNYDQVTIVRNETCETTTSTNTAVDNGTTTTSTTNSTTQPDTERCRLGCPRILAPVCGSDGRNYSNACILRTENCVRSPYQQVTIVSNGTCDTTNTTTTTTTIYPPTVPDPTPRNCSLVCTLILAPVCGSDGVSYPNACSLRVRNCRGSDYNQVTIFNNGSCQAITASTTTATTTTATTITASTTTATTINYP